MMPMRLWLTELEVCRTPVDANQSVRGWNRDMKEDRNPHDAIEFTARISVDGG